MKKGDFHKGQTVWVYLMNNAARGKKTTDERIQEWEVVSVGRKYITARLKGTGEWRNVKFEIENNFRQATTYADDYKLFLTKDNIFHYVWRRETKKYVQEFVRWNVPSIGQMSDEDLQTVSDIFRKYDVKGEQK